MGAYNAFVGSLESQVMTSARRFESLNIDTAGKAIDALPVVEQSPRPLTKLAAVPEIDAEAAEYPPPRGRRVLTARSCATPPILRGCSASASGRVAEPSPGRRGF